MCYKTNIKGKPYYYYLADRKFNKLKTITNDFFIETGRGLVVSAEPQYNNKPFNLTIGHTYQLANIIPTYTGDYIIEIIGYYNTYLNILLLMDKSFTEYIRQCLLYIP